MQLEEVEDSVLGMGNAPEAERAWNILGSNMAEQREQGRANSKRS